ncbi:hypothetical protein [Kitasatospora putterlickiae]|uniref:hypothetical protein n=1 Tax=Kitasatospora putterlickiae TaxID=221725 RepID=UPI003CD06056
MEETCEALIAGLGATRRALAWGREDEHRPLVRAYAEACWATATVAVAGERSAGPVTSGRADS